MISRGFPSPFLSLFRFSSDVAGRDAHAARKRLARTITGRHGRGSSHASSVQNASATRCRAAGSRAGSVVRFDERDERLEARAFVLEIAILVAHDGERGLLGVGEDRRR